MAVRYQSPPGWPTPPPGWTPPQGWVPDARWGPAPPGWIFWVDDVPTDRSDADGSSRTATRATAPADDETRVFISYRRSDALSHANGIQDGLASRLPTATIFMDLDSIPAGLDFEEVIRGEIARCDVVLVVIGAGWLDTDLGTERRRIEDPDDFVRLEIESALADRDVVVIPLLVDGARMPSSTDLPDSIRRLARIHAMELSDQRWRIDITRLVARIAEIGDRGAAAGPRTATTSAPDAPRDPVRPQPTAQRPPEPRPTEQRTTAQRITMLPASQHVPAAPAPAAPPPAWAPPSSRTDRMPPPQVLLSVVMLLVPVLTFGFFAFITPLVAAVTRAGSRAHKALLLVVAGVLLLLVVLTFVLFELAPTAPDGTSTGWQTGAGTLCVLLAIAGGVTVAVVWWRPRQDAAGRRAGGAHGRI